MTARRSRRGLWTVLGLAVAATVLAVIRPWTVVPIQSTPVPAFDPEAYVRSVWPSRIRSTALESAIELRAFMERRSDAAPAKTSPGRAVFVKGTGTVYDIDRTSRVGVARLRVPWTTDAGLVAIQIGPVLRGTALRDALEFIRFTDFVNQLEFAGIANALNDRVLRDVIGALKVDELAGREVTFVGAVPSTSAGRTVEIVPVQLRPSEGAR